MRPKPTFTQRNELSNREVREGIALSGDPWVRRPRVRADCIDGPRPCPWVGCRHNLALYVTELGTIHLNPLFTDGLPESCALDVADAGGLDQVRVAELLGVSRQRAQQLEEVALGRLRKRLRNIGVDGAPTLVDHDYTYPVPPDHFRAIRRALRRFNLINGLENRRFGIWPWLSRAEARGRTGPHFGEG